jgi:Animal haem peroxidase
MKRHGRDDFYVIGEGVYTTGAKEPSVLQEPSTLAALRKFRFSRLGPQGDPVDENQRQINAQVAGAMTADGATNPDSDPGVPAGYTYLGQFVDHDLTSDKTAVHLGQDVTVADLVQGRSPALDLDSLYGLGPDREPRFYEPDGVRLRTGSTAGVGFPPGDPVAGIDQQGFDLPRSGQGSTAAERRAAVIPDARNDENLAVAQTHLMFIKFHNAVVARLLEQGTASSVLFDKARRTVVLHYQWMLRHDFLPRIVDPAVLDDVFTHGRRFFELPAPYGPDPDLYRVHGRPDLLPPEGRGGLNVTKRLDTLLVDPLAKLPRGSFGGRTDVPGAVGPSLNLAFRNLTRAGMVRLATGQQMAQLLEVEPLEPAAVLAGNGGAVIPEGDGDTGLSEQQRSFFAEHTPLWFYVLREAELGQGRLTGVGARIVAEVVHRAMEGSTHSIVRTPSFRPTLGPDEDTFRMVDLLLTAVQGKDGDLARLG